MEERWRAAKMSSCPNERRFVSESVNAIPSADARNGLVVHLAAALWAADPVVNIRVDTGSYRSALSELPPWWTIDLVPVTGLLEARADVVDSRLDLGQLRPPPASCIGEGHDALVEPGDCIDLRRT